MPDFPLHAYLDRLRLTDVAPGAAGLRELQEAHMRAIPFENIDPLLGRTPSLLPDDLVAKLIHGGRGGYCFEQNALFSLALSALGYTPKTILARVRNGAVRGGARTHQALIVKADGEDWLCDAGFGGHAPLAPLNLKTERPQTAPNGTYRIIGDLERRETVIQRGVGDTWSSLYGFDDAPVQAEDLEAANFLCARWTGAPFVTNLLVAFQPDGDRIGLFNRALTVGLPPSATPSVLEDQAELQETLCQRIGLELTDDMIAALWAKIENAPTTR